MPGVIIGAVQLMYLSHADHDKVRQQVQNLKLNHYIFYPSKESLDYIKSLPKTVYSMQMFEEGEYSLLKYLGSHFIPFNEYKLIFEHIHKYLDKHYPQYKVTDLSLTISRI
jgi:hypothetical protein